MGEADLRLARELRKRTRASLAMLNEAYGLLMVRVAYLQLGNHADAQDAAQQALLDAWQAGRSLKNPSRLRSWVLGILINRCRKMKRGWIRRLRRRKTAWELGRSRQQDRRPEATAALEKLARALRALPDAQREVVILRYYRQMSVARTARTLGIPEGTVKSRSHAALRELRGRIERDSEESE